MEYNMDTVVSLMRNVKGRWYHGPTRMGKTWLALKELGVDLTKDIPSQVFMKNSQNKWWDGYTQLKKNGEKMPVLIDELDKVSA